jgi:type I restriction enzyme, S subunit
MSNKNFRLSEIINLIGGGTPKRSIKEYWNGDILWLVVSDFNNDSRYVENSSEKITQLGLENSSTKLLKPGMLIISARGTVGKLSQLDSEMAFSQSCYGIDAKTEFTNNDYLYYLLKMKIKELQSLAHGSIFDTIIRSTFDNIFVDIPSHKEQEQVVSILSNLDEKIKNNEEQNKTLEEIAKTLFKSWFIDFDPVRAKAEGRPTGLSKEISDLFPDSFEDSELGQIPEGFKVDSVDNQYDISIGKTPPRKEPQWFSENHQDIPWVSIRDMGDAGVYINKTSEFLTNEAIEKFNIKVIPKNSVILSFKLTVGRVSILGNEMCTNEAIAHFVPKDDDLSEGFTYCLLKSIRYESLSSTSSIATAVNSKIIKAMKCIFPSKALLIAFNEFCHPIYKKIETNSNENKIILKLRDTLLPKLISGELKIPDVESLIEEASI